MKGSIAVVCTPAATRGFRLAGVEPRAAADGTGASAVVEELLATPGAARPLVLLVEEGLLTALPQPLQRRLRTDPALLAVPFPAPGSEAAATAVSFLLDVLRQAIGQRVRRT